LIRVIDLFSGCGGLSRGFITAGFEVVFAGDNDQDSVNSYNHLIPDSHAALIDIFELAKDTVGHLGAIRDVDVLVGGPPCQGFSAINPKRSLDDPRNTCVDAFIAVVKNISPKVVVIENVSGLVSLNKGRALVSIQEALASMGYEVSIKILQAAHYGVPQSRWRLFIIGSKIGAYEFPSPTHHAKITPNIVRGSELTFHIPDEPDLFINLLPPTTVFDAISDLPEITNGEQRPVSGYPVPSNSEYQTLMRRESDLLSCHATTNLGALQMERVRTISNQGGNWRDLPDHLLPDNIKKQVQKYGPAFGNAARFGRLSWDGRFTTILTQPHLYWGSFIHPTQNRVISVRETARAQSFPDSFAPFGGLSSQYRQIGNAVPPLLSEAVARNVLKLFE